MDTAANILIAIITIAIVKIIYVTYTIRYMDSTGGSQLALITIIII